MAPPKMRVRNGGEFCSAPNCQNSRYNTACKGWSFFRFPRDQARCDLWKQNCRRADLMTKTANELNAGGYTLCRIHFEDNQFNRPDKKDRLVFNAVPTIFDVLNPPRPLKSTRSSHKKRCSLPADYQIKKCRVSGMQNDAEGQEAAQVNMATSQLADEGLQSDCGRHLISGSLPMYGMPQNSIVTPQPTSRKPKAIKTNGGCETGRTELCLKKKQKRKLAKEVESKTCNDEHSVSEQEFIIKLEDDGDSEDTDGHNFLASGTETVLVNGVKIQPRSNPGDKYEANNISEDSRGHSSHPADAAKMVKLEPDSDSTEWPAVTGLLDTGAATETEVKTEPCSDTESEPPVFFEPSN